MSLQRLSHFSFPLSTPHLPHLAFLCSPIFLFSFIKKKIVLHHIIIIIFIYLFLYKRYLFPHIFSFIPSTHFALYAVFRHISFSLLFSSLCLEFIVSFHFLSSLLLYCIKCALFICFLLSLFNVVVSRFHLPYFMSLCLPSLSRRRNPLQYTFKTSFIPFVTFILYFPFPPSRFFPSP